jgi:hypothetical protein
MQQREIAAVGQKSNLARRGMFHSGDSDNFGRGFAFQAARKFLCDVREFH